MGLLTHGVKQLQEIIYSSYYSRNVSAEKMILSFVAQRSSHLLKIIFFGTEKCKVIFFLPYNMNNTGGKKISV